MSLSVLLSIYIKEKPEYFERSLKSIYDEQVVKPDEIVLVKDGKLTNELEIVIDKWKIKLPKIIKVIVLKENVGLAQALNIGLKSCTCDYIARMDTDDISLPNRFSKQMAFMLNENVDMCGSNALLINNNSDIVGQKKVLEKVSFNSLLKNCDVIHPSAMFKKDFFKQFGKYNPDFKKSQDYELWLRATKNGAKIKNISESLLHFRISDDLVKRRKDEQKYNIKIKKEYISGLKYYINIIPNILIIILPIALLKFILKIKSKV